MEPEIVDIGPNKDAQVRRQEPAGVDDETAEQIFVQVDDNFVPSSAPEPSSIMVPLYRLPATSTLAEDDDSVPSAAPEPSAITVPLYRLPASSMSAEGNEFVDFEVQEEEPEVVGVGPDEKIIDVRCQEPINSWSQMTGRQSQLGELG